MSERRRRRRHLWTLLLLLALVSLATRLYSLPLNRVIESRYCHSYYLEHDPSKIPNNGEVPEDLCKEKPVQQKLAWLQGFTETAIIGVDLFVTLPLGWLSDTNGRKVILWLNSFGFVLMVTWTVLVGYLDRLLPIEAVAAGPFFMLIGGHNCVLFSTVFALVADLTDHLLQRTSWIAYITSVNYVITLFGPSLAGLTMSAGLWLPFYISIALLVVALAVTNSIQSIPAKEAPVRHNSDCRNSDNVPLLRHFEGYGVIRDQVSPPKPQTLRNRLSEQLKSTKNLVLGRRNFQVLLLCFTLTALASSNTHLLPLYMSKRYNWSFANVGYLLSVKAVVNITLLAFIIPTTMRALLRKHPRSEVPLNFYGAQISIFVSVAGALLIASAPKIGELVAALIVYALGSALPVFTIPLVESPVVALPDSNSQAQDYSIVMLTKTTGELIGAPLMTVAWVKAIEFGGAGLGLPYFLSAVSASTTIDC
ncbi:MFS general substrate transporter [Saccharata proteae CBS 121410]|uniref:MFS general substrate transporter n=1 Tax=Saccharata proteae CBS 121410 TaxID=1314787 RepID=A0A9P4LVU0_9PEZI|nr:MFS general substrate transporter [Saccharata proteae CBS 121410]